MIKKTLSTSVIALVVLLNVAVDAEELSETNSDKSKVGITGKFGTLGAGVDLTYGISDKVNVRFNVNGGKIDADGEKDGVNYKGKIDALTAGGLIDYHPMGGGFRISAGLYNNSNELKLDTAGSSNTNVVVGANSYDLSNASLKMDVGVKKVAPYLGIGWGNAVNKEKQWNVSLDVGVLFQGSPEIKLTGTGTAKELITGQSVDLGTSAIFQEDLQKEETNLNGDVKDFKAYPVLSLGMSYRFY